MKTKYDKLSHLACHRVLGVIRGKNLSQMEELAEATIAAGCCIIELSMMVPGVSDLIFDLKHKHGDRVMIGAGTVHDAETCRIALLAGADFIAGPEYDEDVSRMCNLYCSVYFAGCFTASEIRTALLGGADIIKVFPASVMDVKTFFSICNFFPGSLVMPAGGVNISNAKQFLDHGAFLVGCPFGSTKDEILKAFPEFISAIEPC